MKSKASITLSTELLQAIDGISEGGNRSQFIEAALEHYIRYLEKRALAKKDLAIIERHHKRLNKEAEDVLGYQLPI